MTFAVDAPIFVFREFMRHRIASYSEMSARYVEMLPRFYSYPEGRPLVQAGSSAHPDLVDGDEDLHRLVTTSTVTATVTAWEEYQRMLTAGAAREVARAVLPVSTFSRMWVSVNLRSLMNFLSLRVDGKDAALFETKPQWEIEQVARAMEEHFAAAFPHTHAAFVASKRVSP